MSMKTSYGMNVYNVYNSLKHHFRNCFLKVHATMSFHYKVGGGGSICTKPILAVLIKASIYKCIASKYKHIASDNMRG